MVLEGATSEGSLGLTARSLFRCTTHSSPTLLLSLFSSYLSILTNDFIILQPKTFSKAQSFNQIMKMK